MWCTIMHNSVLILCINADREDLPDVIEEVMAIQSRYYSLGRSLRLDTKDLKAIRDAYPSDHDSSSEEALEDVLLLWLDRKYNVSRFGPPSWRMLVVAVDMKSGGNNHELAKEIASKHPAG